MVRSSAMALRQKIERGELGVVLSLPGDAEVLQERDNYLAARDPTRGVVWEIANMPWRLDLDARHTQTLRTDIERHARADFESTFHELRAQSDDAGDPPFAPDRGPRTDDASWSPVIECQTDERDGHRFLRTIHRITYHPGSERIAGRILVPTPHGVIEFSAHAADATTGYRESVLMISVLQGAPSQDPADAHPGQAAFDDPEHDARFPQHPLSRIRRALAWLCASDGGALRIVGGNTGAGVEANIDGRARDSGEVELPEAGCAIVPPPRYVRLPGGTLPMSPTLANFTRVLHSAHITPYLLDVWMLPHQRLGPRDIRGLKKLALDTTRAFAKEGAKDIEIDVLDEGIAAGRPVLTCEARYSAGQRVQSIQMWTIDRDGVVFRISAATPLFVPLAEVRANVTAAMASWRRLS